MESLQLSPRLHAIGLKYLVAKKKKKNPHTSFLQESNELHCKQV